MSIVVFFFFKLTLSLLDSHCFKLDADETEKELLTFTVA